MNHSDPNNPEEILHVGKPNKGDRAVFDRLVDGIFERCWFTNNGEVVRELEQVLADYLGVDHVILVCNGTVGLQLALHALELKGEVIVPAFTFVATPHAVQWEGLQPVFCDVDPRTHTLDPSSVEERITSRTSAIIGVHVWGTPCDTDRLQAIADRHRLSLLYDAAHAVGCRHQGRMIGNFGACEVFSFHATKCFNTFEGGAVTTNDPALAERLRLMKNFGFRGIDKVVHLGTNAKMPEICAAMGLACFARLEEIIATNRRNYRAYRDRLADLPGVRFFEYPNENDVNCQYVVVEIDDTLAGISRDALMEYLHERGIRARRYFYPGCHRMEPYAGLYPEQPACLGNTNTLCRRVLCLPTGEAVSLEGVDRVCQGLERALSGMTKVSPGRKA